MPTAGWPCCAPAWPRPPLGLGLFVFAGNIWLATAGAALWGVGAALAFPMGMSAAADDPKHAAARVSVVSTLGYIAFLAGPPLLGYLGDVTGIRMALLAIGIPILVCPAARRRREAPARQPAGCAGASPVALRSMVVRCEAC